MPKVKSQRVVLGITGGVATGKSMVLSLLAQKGIPTLSADDLAHACIRKGRPAYRTILRSFGSAILDQQNEINRKALGKIVFSDAKARRRLEEIVHPCVLKAFQHFISGKKGIVAVDIPLLYEAGYERFIDTVIVVYSTRAQQVERLRRRNGLGRRDALQRIAAQMPLSVKCRRADVVIDNTGSLAHLRQQIRQAAFLARL